MTDLFVAEAVEEKPDWMNLTARKLHGMPDRWRWFSAQVKNRGKPSQFILLRGAVCEAKFERGKRKGHDNWAKRDLATEAEVAIRFDEIETVKVAWESENKKCFGCYGTGKEFRGWSVSEGITYRPCSRCKETGKPPSPTTDQVRG